MSQKQVIEIMQKQKAAEDKRRPRMLKRCEKGIHEKREAWSETKIPIMGGEPGPTRTQWYCRWCGKDLGITEEPGWGKQT